MRVCSKEVRCSCFEVCTGSFVSFSGGDIANGKMGGGRGGGREIQLLQKWNVKK